ncbi:hypothetical protein ANCCEY_01360 [Ancylostoma ceylanicum]|uniref:Uncharacterized protein n=1 Tax=Ancylostoma ceylanicum TaxID=53326 RepID=A0A0D6M5Y3_9BILA|nr:hypothetical protein ANCCEY_01360 [Ancylostoma ceylanicum]
MLTNFWIRARAKITIDPSLTADGYVRANYEAAKVNADGVEDIVADMLKKAQANIRRKVRGDRQLYFEK